MIFDKREINDIKLEEMGLGNDFFLRLADKVREKVLDNKVYLRKCYFFRDAIVEDYKKLYGFMAFNNNPKVLKKLYYKYLFENNKIIDDLSILVRKVNEKEERELITDIALPRLEISGNTSLFSAEINSKLFLSSNNTDYSLYSTNFLAFGNNEEYSLDEIESYIQMFSDKDYYLELLNRLLVSMESCFYSFRGYELSYIPDNLKTYYYRMYSFINREINKMVSNFNDEEYFVKKLKRK